MYEVKITIAMIALFFLENSKLIDQRFGASPKGKIWLGSYLMAPQGKE